MPIRGSSKAKCLMQDWGRTNRLICISPAGEKHLSRGKWTRSLITLTLKETESVYWAQKHQIESFNSLDLQIKSGTESLIPDQEPMEFTSKTNPNPILCQMRRAGWKGTGPDHWGSPVEPVEMSQLRTSILWLIQQLSESRLAWALITRWFTCHRTASSPPHPTPVISLRWQQNWNPEESEASFF